MHSDPIYLWIIVILTSHLCLGPKSRLLLSSFPTKHSTHFSPYVAHVHPLPLNVLMSRCKRISHMNKNQCKIQGNSKQGMQMFQGLITCASFSSMIYTLSWRSRRTVSNVNCTLAAGDSPPILIQLSRLAMVHLSCVFPQSTSLSFNCLQTM